MKTTRRHTAIILSVTFFVTLLAGCHGGDDDDPAAAAKALDQALAPREVQLIRPEVREEHPTLELVGEVRPFDTLEISPEVAGKVDRVLVEVGDRVQPGTPLLEVDRETFHIYLDQAEANLAAARADLNLAAKALERKRDLLTDETIPQAAFDEAEAAHELARARVAAAEAARSLAARNSERSVVRAPAVGAITERHVVAGQWTDVGQMLLEMAIGNTVKIAARVPEAWAAKLSGLESFEFTVGPAGARREARLYSVQPVVEEASRSFEIIGTATNDGSIKPGMFANVRLSSPQPLTTLWLPAAAVATSDMSQVMIVADDVVIFRRVRIGRRLDAMIEIIDGLSAEESVIAEVAGLHRGLPVLIVGGADDE